MECPTCGSTGKEHRKDLFFEGKKPIHVVCHQKAGVYVTGATFKYKFDITYTFKKKANWNKESKAWVITDTPLDDVSKLIEAETSKEQTRKSKVRKDAAKVAAETRRCKEKRFTEKEKKEFEENYREWLNMPYCFDPAAITKEDGAFTICYSCKRPIFSRKYEYGCMSGCRHCGKTFLD